MWLQDVRFHTHHSWCMRHTGHSSWKTPTAEVHVKPRILTNGLLRAQCLFQAPSRRFWPFDNLCTSVWKSRAGGRIFNQKIPLHITCTRTSWSEITTVCPSAFPHEQTCPTSDQSHNTLCIHLWIKSSDQALCQEEADPDVRTKQCDLRYITMSMRDDFLSLDRV